MTQSKNGNTVLEIDNTNGISVNYSSVLEDKFLINRIVREVNKTFYGEEDTILALIVSINTRLVIGAKPESKNIVLSDESGSGKDSLAKTLCNIMLEPEKTYFHRAKITPETFTYWHSEDNISWNWEGKVIHLEDTTEELLTHPTVKTMLSGESKATVVDKQRARDIDHKGKPNFIITTYEGCANMESIRRLPYIPMDTSPELTKKVIEGICNRYSGKVTIDRDIELRNALKTLKPFKVTIPFADKLSKKLPHNLLMRTFSHRLLDYIASSTVLHQHQRELDKDGRLIATGFDYDLGRIAFLKTLSNSMMVSLTVEQKRLLNWLLEQDEAKFFSEIVERIPRSKPWIYDNVDYLIRCGLAYKTTRWKPDANKEVTVVGGCKGVLTSCQFPSTDRLSGCKGCKQNIRMLGEKYIQAYY